jgi:PAS domain S-box-containing protein
MSERPPLPAEGELSTVLHALLASAPWGFAILDFELRFVFINDTLAAITELSGTDLTGRSLAEVAPELAKQWEPILRRVLDAGEPLLNREVSAEAPTPAGEPCHWLVSCSLARGPSGHALGVGIAVADISEQKRAENALRFVQNYAPCLLWYSVVEESTETASGYRWIVHAFEDEAAQRFLPLDIPPERRYRDAWHFSRPPEDRQRATETYVAALKAGREHYAQEFRCLRQDGELRWIHEQVHVEPLDAGRWHFVGVCTDITEQKRLEEELRRKADDLVRADQSKDEVLARLAHELRNPLAPILNAVGVLKRVGSEEPLSIRAWEIIERQVRHQARLIDDLLDISRITRGKITLRPERLDLVRLVRDTTEDRRSLLEAEDRDLVLQLPGDPLWVEGDPTRLAQVVGNLLDNAAKFTNPGGCITVSVAQSGDEARTAEIRVRDSGIGIEPEILPHVFDTFAQADRTLERSSGGLGLGLALVKGLVALHGGEAQAESDGIGCGAEFTVRLPAIAAPDAGGPAPVHRRSAGPLRVLIVEDHRDAAESLRDLLELSGCTVQVAYSGRRGVETARQFRPDVVLCDLGLPELNGYEVAAALRADPTTATARLIALSGYGREEDQLRCRQAGFDLHLTKPVDFAELERLLEPEPGGSLTGRL